VVGTLDDGRGALSAPAVGLRGTAEELVSLVGLLTREGGALVDPSFDTEGTEGMEGMEGIWTGHLPLVCLYQATKTIKPTRATIKIKPMASPAAC